jgi:Tfp pilus assembly PilM family ATPase
MAQKAQILDIGSYSAKSIATRVPIIGFAVSGAKEQLCASALEPKARRTDQLKAARELLPGKKVAGDAISVLMPAERVLNRFVDMPFADRTKIDSVLAFELENHVPLTSEEFLHDYVITSKRKDGATLFVSLIPVKEVDEYRESFAHFNIDPRVLIHQAVSNARLLDLMSEAPTGRVALVDIGHRKSVVTLVEAGRFVGTRVILHAGYELTRGLSERFGQSMEEAQSEKHSAHLYPAGDGLAVGRVQEIADCLREGLSPLLRDLNQTFKALGAVDEIYIFGGSAKLGGIDQCIRDTFKLPVHLLRPSMLKIGNGLEDDDLQYVSGVAAGLASHKGSDAQRINLRQGLFAYIGDFRFMRGRLIYLGVLLVMMLSAFITPQILRYQAVQDRESEQRSELLKLSKRILGEELEDADEIMGRLSGMPSAEVWSVFPDLSAHEVYWEVADIVARIDGQPTGELIQPPPLEEEALPGSPEEGKASVPEGLVPPPLEGSAPPPEGMTPEPLVPAGPVEAVHRLEMNQIRIDGATRTAIGGGTVEFTGNASSVATMELYLSLVGKHPCFHNVQKTKQEMLKATAGKEGWWRFTAEFGVSCPRKAAEEIASKKEAEAAKTAAGDAAPEGPPAKDRKTGEKPGKPRLPDAQGKEGKKVFPRKGDKEAPARKDGKEGKEKADRKRLGPAAEPAEREKKREVLRTPPARELVREAPADELAPRTDGAREPAARGTGKLSRPLRRNLNNSRPLVPTIPHERLSNPSNTLGRE